MQARDARFRALMDANQVRLRAISRTWAPRAWEDLYQEIALRLWRSLDQFEGRARLDTWVYRVALNTAIDFVRRERRRDAREICAADAPEIPVPSRSPDPLAILQEFAASLGDIDRAVLVMYVDGVAQRDIAGVVGLSEGAVGVRIHRLKAAFRRAYVEERHGAR
jgi:RNA polymerase sigma-70 factor (ECF subfamily)